MNLIARIFVMKSNVHMLTTMPKLRYQSFFVILTIVILFFQSVHANSGDLSSAIKRLVESSRLKQEQLSLILAGPNGEELYKLNEKKKMIPASLTKIITAAAILEKLPVGYQFVTEIKADKSLIQKETLNGPLYLLGGGDAGFVSESMWFLVNEFLRSGIKTIKGDIIVDDSRFDQIRFDSSRDQDRVDRAYDAPIGAMTFNWSAVNIFVRPAEKAGEAARVFADPQNSYIQIVNKAKTVAAGRKTSIEVNNLGYNSKNDTETVVVSGTISADAAEFVAYKSITKPEIWAGLQLIEFLKQRGVSVTGKVKAGTVPARAQSLAQHKSKSVGEIVSDMMKFSNNYIAEILTKNLAFEVKKKQGTMAAGVEVITEFLHKTGVNDFVFSNPAGLSRKNLFQAKDLLLILERVKGQFSIYPEYLTGFPIAGVDGTLKRRIKQQEYAGRIRAKTGHLTGVNGLGGYISDLSGNTYPFIFVFNGSADDAYKSQELFDRILLEFLKVK